MRLDANQSSMSQASDLRGGARRTETSLCPPPSGVPPSSPRAARTGAAEDAAPVLSPCSGDEPSAGLAIAALRSACECVAGAKLAPAGDSLLEGSAAPVPGGRLFATPPAGVVCAPVPAGLWDAEGTAAETD